MKLIEGWRSELNKVWSIRAAIWTAVLASADQILAQFVGHMPPVIYAFLSIGFIVLRLLDQK